MTSEASAEAVWAEAVRRYPETEPAYANRGMVSHEIRDQREAFEDGWEAATQASEGRIAQLVRDMGEIEEMAWLHDSGIAQRIHAVAARALTSQVQGE